MSQKSGFFSTLGRIANALERIADALETQNAQQTYEPKKQHSNLGISKHLQEPNTNQEPSPKDDPDEQKQRDFVVESLEEIEDKELESIEGFLNSKQIQIKNVPTEDPADEVINSLSEFLGSNYGSVHELLSRIKRNMQNGGAFVLPIKDYTQKDISSVCQFCTRLHDIAFLEHYKYYKSPQFLIKAKTTSLPIAQNFFSGKWLERFVLLTVQKVVSKISHEINYSLAYSYMLNPQVILPNGDDFELDLVFQVNGSFFWMEAKSGDYQHHINKYSKISRLLNLDVKHSIMILTDIAPEKSDNLTSLFSMSVYSLAELEEMLTQTIREDLFEDA